MLKAHNLLLGADVRLIVGRSQKKTAELPRIAAQKIIVAL